jgi:hypothetical protein
MIAMNNLSLIIGVFLIQDFLFTVAKDAFFSDPYYEQESWVFHMINIQPVWVRGIYGTGVHIRINDEGVDFSHPEFAGRVDIDNSCDDYLPATSDRRHGTFVASIAAAAGNNGECAVGIAPQATISSCEIIDHRTNIGYKLDKVDISQNSWGIPSCKAKEEEKRRRNLQTRGCPFLISKSTPCLVCDFTNPSLSSECEDFIILYCSNPYIYQQDSGCVDFLDLFTTCEYNSIDLDTQEIISRAIRDGRNGKGIIFTFASGNGYGQGSDVNFEFLVQSPFTISVGAVDKFKKHAPYSNGGAALLVSAPGGDSRSNPNHVGALVGGGCAAMGVGTSFACPVVSGVVALMLEINPLLGWRDVQGILALTSQVVLDDNDSSLTTNAAGYRHSNLYGFGIIDASAAVDAALSWENFGPEEMIMVESRLVNIPIIDDQSTSAVSSLTLSSNSAAGFVAESVVIYLDIKHASRGDLSITLISPQGTLSQLHSSGRPENTQLAEGDRFKLMTVRAWGESADGEWTLSIIDESIGDLTECIDIPAVFAYQYLFYCSDLPLMENYLGETLCEDDQVISPLASSIRGPDGISPASACCACGGGRASTDITDVLASWRLVVYGRSPVVESNSLPSAFPSVSPIASPSARPSGSPSVRPSGSPSVRPSGSPSVHPSGSPIASTSVWPSDKPSTSPSAPPSDKPSTSTSAPPSDKPNTSPSATPSSLVLPNVGSIPLFASKPKPVPSSTPTEEGDILSSQPSTKPWYQLDFSFGNPTSLSSNPPTTRTPSSAPTSMVDSFMPSNTPSATPSTTTAEKNMFDRTDATTGTDRGSPVVGTETNAGAEPALPPIFPSSPQGAPSTAPPTSAVNQQSITKSGAVDSGPSWSILVGPFLTLVVSMLMFG